MRKLSLGLLIVAFAHQSPAQTPTDTLRQLDSTWARSYATNDTALAAKLFERAMLWYDHTAQRPWSRDWRSGRLR